LAKAAYNAGKYGEAIGHFRSLARRWPANGAVYRALARAYTWDGKTNQAITAYRDYLTLAPDAGDREKIQAELDLVLRKSKSPPKAGPPKGVTKALARINKRVEAGRLGGRDGAVAAHQKLMGGTYVGPALARARDAVHGALVSRSEAAIAAWWSPAEAVSGDTTVDLTSAWKTLSEIDAPAPRNARILTTAVAGLDHLLAGRHAEAVTVLESVAPGDLRLRYAQAVALLGAKRVDEAKQLLTALARGEADPRIYLVLGLLGGANAKPEGIDRLHQALSKP
jgi:predicted Zn-dependent protease